MKTLGRVGFLVPIFIGVHFGVPSAWGKLGDDVFLKDAIKRVCEASPEKKLGEALEEEAALRTTVAERFWLPTLETKTRLGVQDGRALARGEKELSAFTLSARFPFREMLNNFREIEARRTDQRIQQIETQRSLNERLRILFENLIRLQSATERLAVFESSLEQYDLQIRTQQNRVRSGLTSDRDLLRIQSERDRVERILLSEKSQVLSYEMLLANEFQLEKAVAPKKWDLFKEGSFRLDEILDVQLEREREKRSQADLQMEESVMTPNLRIFGEGSYGSQGWAKTRFPQEQWSAAAGIELNWTLWDGGLERAERAARWAGVERSRLNKRRAEERFSTKIRVTESQRNLFARSKELIKRSLDAQEKTFRNVTTEYRSGRLSYLDWITTQNALDAIRLDQIENEVSLKVLDLEIGALTGRLMTVSCGGSQ